LLRSISDEIDLTAAGNEANIDRPGPKRVRRTWEESRNHGRQGRVVPWLFDRKFVARARFENGRGLSALGGW